MWIRNCPDDEVVDVYSLNRLTGRELEAFEEHLFVCERCQKRVREADQFRDAFRVAWHRTEEGLAQRALGRLRRIFASWLP